MSKLTFIKYWWINSKRISIFLWIVAVGCLFIPTGQYFSILALGIWLITIFGSWIVWKRDIRGKS